ncbi:MAG: NUDIX domain-containing protein [Lachnospiraceae bacterium]|nr:NUDIX domain-containing protein [Lachnospiraceae bacterium]
MKYDCGFEKGNNWFRYRTGGFLIHNNKMLFVKSNIGDYYYMIGGGVHLGETSKDCIEREVLEEAGINAKVDYLAVVCENFFKGSGGIINGLDCHTIEFYYYMNILDSDLSSCKHTTDDGEELVWLRVEEIETSEIKPAFIKEYINKVINERKTFHIIEEIDR